MIIRIIKYCFSIFIVAASFIFGQNNELKKGNVSYISSQYIYLKFDNTEGISIGDSLFYQANSELVHCLVIKYLSSSSAAGMKICDRQFNIGDEIYANLSKKEELTEVLKETDEKILNEENLHSEDVKKLIDKPRMESSLNGRISISSYSNFSNIGRKNDYQRWRYLFSLNAKNINGIPLTFNNYITFAYRPDQWANIEENIGRALRVYDFSLEYDLSYKSSITFGRKNNLKISNLGSIDGLQFQTKIGKLETGIVLGSRPNFSDYGYNYKMFQYGIYLSRTDTLANGTMQNTIAAFEQTNNFYTDRRFLYVQHINNSIKNINLFASSEIDIYKRKNGIAENTFSLTSFYISARYNPSRYISFSTSYDARKNVVYFETYKNYADSLLESETRQGLRFSSNIRPFNFISIGLHYGYRFRNYDVESTNNYGGYINFNSMPVIKSTLNISFNKLSTSYLNGTIIGFRIYKYIIPSFLNSGISYKKINYDYKSSSYSLKQNIINVDLTFQLFAKIFLSANYEGTFEEIKTYNRIYLNLTTRF